MRQRLVTPENKKWWTLVAASGRQTTSVTRSSVLAPPLVTLCHKDRDCLLP